MCPGGTWRADAHLWTRNKAKGKQNKIKQKNKWATNVHIFSRSELQVEEKFSLTFLFLFILYYHLLRLPTSPPSALLFPPFG